MELKIPVCEVSYMLFSGLYLAEYPCSSVLGLGADITEAIDSLLLGLDQENSALDIELRLGLEKH